MTLKLFYKLVLYYFNVLFITYLKFEENQFRISKVFLILNTLTMFLFCLVPMFVPQQTVFENTNMDLIDMKSSSPFLTGIIYVYGFHSGSVRMFCLIFLFVKRNMILNLTNKCFKTFKLFKISESSKQFILFEKIMRKKFFFFSFVSFVLKISNFLATSRVTILGFLVFFVKEPLESLLFPFIQGIALLLSFFHFLIQDLRINFSKLKKDDLRSRFKSIMFLVESFNRMIGLVLTLAVIDITLSTVTTVR